MISSIGGFGMRTGLGGEGKGDLVTGRLSNHNLGLVHGVGGVLELGNIEALLFNIISADDLGDFNGLGDADLDGLGVSDVDLNGEGGGDKGDLVGLGLVFLTTKLMFSVTISRSSISGGFAGSYLHGLSLGLIGDLGGLSGGDNIFLLIGVGADLTVDSGGCFLTDGEDTVKAVVIVHDNLNGQSDGGHSGLEGWHADLGVD